MTTTNTTPQAEIKLPSMLHGSFLQPLHRYPRLRPALLSIPAWREAAEAFTYLESIRPTRTGVASPEEEMVGYVADLVAHRGGYDPEAAVDVAFKAHSRLAAMTVVHAGFDRAAEMYSRQLDEAVTTNVNRLFKHLHDQVVEMVDTARGTADVFAMDAADAIRAGKADAFQAAEDLRERYKALQIDLGTLRRGLLWSHPQTGKYYELDYIANPRDLFEHWRAWKVDGYITNGRDKRTLTPPWPDQGGPRAAVAWLEYLARTPEAEAWVPNPDQFDQAATELLRYSRELRGQERAPRQVGNKQARPAKFGEAR